MLKLLVIIYINENNKLILDIEISEGKNTFLEIFFG